MKNNKKTKTQLITELEELRKQNAELEAEKTVRRKEEETLKVSEKNYSKIFNNAGVSFWEYDFTNALLITDRLKAKGITDFRSYFEENPKIAKKLISSIKLTDITDTTLKLYSARTKDELLVSLGKKESPESYKTFLDATIAYLKGNKYFECEAINQTPDGKFFNVLVRINFSFTRLDGHKALVTVIDITELKRAEEALKQESDIQTTLIEALPYPTMLIRRDRTIIFANKVAREGGAVVGGQCWRDFGHCEYIPDEDKACIDQHQEKPPGGTHCTFCLADDALNGSKTDIATEILAFGRIWEIYWVPVSKDVYLHYALDITERKKAEEALRENEEKYRNLIETSQDLIFQSDKEGRFIYLNENWEKTLGYSIDEMLGRKHSDFKKEDIARRDIKEFERVLKEGSTKGYETSYVSKSGDDVHLSFAAMLLYDKEGLITGTIGSADDITERKKAEEQIKNSLKEKELLLQEIHHRVKNNLQIISSLLTLKSENIKDKKVAELIFEIKNSIGTMVKIHERLYQSENLSNINFKDYIKEIANDLVLAYYPDNKDIVSINYNVEDISLGINTAIPCGLVLNELITNSLKHAFPGNRKGQININMRSVNDNYECIVMDNGIGISKDFDVAKIKTIGLYLATGIIEKQLCGKIDFIRSSGTIVKITFPQRS